MSVILKKCQYCRNQIESPKLVLHEMYCERNCIKCDRCGLMYDKNDPESHEEEFHKSVECPHCHEGFPDLSLHKCYKQPTLCPYCKLDIPLNKFKEHEQGCGSRTEKCESCSQYVKIKDFTDHPRFCPVQKLSQPLHKMNEEFPGLENIEQQQQNQRKKVIDRFPYNEKQQQKQEQQNNLKQQFSQPIARQYGQEQQLLEQQPEQFNQLNKQSQHQKKPIFNDSAKPPQMSSAPIAYNGLDQSQRQNGNQQQENPFDQSKRTIGKPYKPQFSPPKFEQSQPLQGSQRSERVQHNQRPINDQIQKSYEFSQLGKQPFQEELLEQNPPQILYKSNYERRQQEVNQDQFRGIQARQPPPMIQQPPSVISQQSQPPNQQLFQSENLSAKKYRNNHDQNAYQKPQFIPKSNMVPSQDSQIAIKVQAELNAQEAGMSQEEYCQQLEQHMSLYNNKQPQAGIYSNLMYKPEDLGPPKQVSKIEHYQEVNPNEFDFLSEEEKQMQRYILEDYERKERKYQ